jgi:hypothetical protein
MSPQSVYVIPITIALSAPPSQREAAFDRLASLLGQPLVRSLLRSKGIPFLRLSRDRATPFDRYFAAPFWFFLDCATPEAARDAKARASDLLGASELVAIARMNGLTLASVNVGEPSPYTGDG